MADAGPGPAATRPAREASDDEASSESEAAPRARPVKSAAVQTARSARRHAAAHSSADGVAGSEDSDGEALGHASPLTASRRRSAGSPGGRSSCERDGDHFKGWSTEEWNAPFVRRTRDKLNSFGRKAERAAKDSSTQRERGETTGADEGEEERERQRLEDLAEYLCSSEEEESWHPLHEAPATPANEEARLEALRSLQLLDGPPDEHLSRLATLARRSFNVPMCWIALIDRDREWCLASDGFPFPQVHRHISLGAFTILQEGPLWVSDASLDARFRYNKLVHDKPMIRFWLATPLTLTVDGAAHAIGAMLVADTEPRSRDSHPTGGDVRLLQTLASAAVRRIETSPRQNVRPECNMNDPLNRFKVLREFMSVAGVNMDDDLLKTLSERLKPRVVPSDTFIVRKGDQGSSMYFVVSGYCVCALNGQPVERIGKGGCFGELAVMNMCKMRAAGIPDDMIARKVVRMADIRAVERCELLELTFESAWPLIREIPALWSKLEEIRKARAAKIRANPSLPP